MHQALRHSAIALALIGSGALAACADDAAVLAPESAPDGPAFARPAPVDISGQWNWSERGRLILTVEATPLFGVVPEGPRTILVCESGGTLTIDQSGDTFTGSATQTSSCETNGGQVVVPPAFPPALDIVDGTIRGARISFTFGAGPIPCPYTAVVSSGGGVATALNGTGRCIVPGHPQSPLPVPPPPIAPTKTIEWNAWR